MIQEIASCGPTEGPEGSSGNAEFIVRACNAYDDLMWIAEMLTKMDESEGLSPVALGLLRRRAVSAIKIAKGE